MASVEQIRRTIRQALANAGHSAIAVAKEMGRGRDYLRDFLEGKKASIDMEISMGLSEKYGIPINDLRPTKPQPPMIRKGARPHLYLAEHMAARNLDDQTMASRIDGISPEAVAKWRTDPSKLQGWQVGAILHALDLEDEAELSRLPAPAKRTQQPRKATARKRA